MKVLVPLLRSLSTPHYETDLEIAQRHLDRGDTVHLLTCTSSIPTCDYVAHHSAGACLRCIERRAEGLNRLSPSPSTHEVLRLTPENREVLRSIPDVFSDQQELRSFRVGDFDVGMGVLSTLISKTRKLNLDVAGQKSGLVRDMVHTGAAIYFSMQNYIRELKPDRVYVFNGRFNTTRAVLRACKETGTTCYTHDRGHDLHHFETYENTTPHDLSYMHQQVEQYWQNADPEEREAEADRFYEQRAAGYIPNWKSFTGDQSKKELPDGFDETKRNIAVYPSSEDEFAAIGEEWSNPVYSDQLTGLRKIVADLKTIPEIHLYVRVHPNLSEVDNAQTRGMRMLDNQERVTVIPADSPVSSYALLHASDCVLTFGSTMGIEATYWRKPSILAGMSLYKSLGGTHTPKAHQEVLDVLQDPSLSPKPKEPALKYGHYQATKGTAFKYFEGTDVFEGRFKGQVITHRQNSLSKLAMRLTKSGKMQPLWRAISSVTYRRAKRRVEIE